MLLYKQDFTKKLGLCCITCTYCSQTCQRGVTEQLDGSTWDFCSEDCKTKYLLWYCKVRRVNMSDRRRQGYELMYSHQHQPSREGSRPLQSLNRLSLQREKPWLILEEGPSTFSKGRSDHSVHALRLPGAMPVSARESCWKPSTGAGKSVISATNSVCCASTVSRTNPTWIPRVGQKAS